MVYLFLEIRIPAWAWHSAGVDTAELEKHKMGGSRRALVIHARRTVAQMCTVGTIVLKCFAMPDSLALEEWRFAN
jgi:hypothetical protein